MNEIECVKCGFKTTWGEVVKPGKGVICPKCGSIDPFTEVDDGVNDDTYRKDNPIEPVNE